MRGEHILDSVLSEISLGSSPHARGAHYFGNKQQPQPGIIPACAGSTVYQNPSNTHGWDHPRMRGEHFL